MPTISIIVAIDNNRAIGKNNRMLCHLPNDLKYFKSVTQGHTVIMGRKTFESLPNGALPNRRNMVISRNTKLELPDVEIYSSIQEALNTVDKEEEVFIMGGGEIYRQTISIASKLYITYIHHSFEDADTFFPEISRMEWKEVFSELQQADDKNKYAHTFVVYERIS